MFTESTLKQTNFMLAIKLFSPAAEAMTYKKILKLSKKLRGSYPDHFKNCIVPEQPPPGTNDYLIIDAKNKRQIVVSNAHVQYNENKSLNNHTFDKICMLLYDFYLEELPISSDDLKLIGKVRDYKVTGIKLFSDFVEKIQIVKDEKPIKFDFKFTYVREGMNIHVSIAGHGREEDDEPNLTLRFDINNYDQTLGLTDDSFKEILDFENSFHKDLLYDFLNHKMLGGIEERQQ
jgi:hypothetical protein